MIKLFHQLSQILFTSTLLLFGESSVCEQTSPKPHIGFSFVETSRHQVDWLPDSDTKQLTGWYWYPAFGSRGDITTYRNYLRYFSPDTPPNEKSGLFHRIINGFQEDTISIQSVEAYFDRQSPVHEIGGKPRQQIPLIVLSGAHPIYFIELAERLAQAGFGVLSVPRTGRKKGEGLPYTREGVQVYESDLQAILDHLNAAEKGLAFISWSFEGVATLHLADKVLTKCYLSLDAAIGYEYGVSLIDSSLFDQNFTFPMLHYTGKELGHGKKLEFLERHSDQVRLVYDFDFSHGDFTSLSSLTAHRILHGTSNERYEALVDDIEMRLSAAFDKKD